MQVESKFYERLHDKDVTYGKNVYDVPRLIGTAAFRRWLQRAGKSNLRVLDIGCGKAQFLFDVTEALRNQHQARMTRVAVVDLVRAEGSMLDKITPKPEFFQQSVDGQKLPFADASFDFVSCNHVLEHIFETEKFLREIRQLDLEKVARFFDEHIRQHAKPNETTAFDNQIKAAQRSIDQGGRDFEGHAHWPPSFRTVTMLRIEPGTAPFT